MTGRAISHYRILEKLGEGGMGAVWKAEDTRLKRTVALKFIPPQTVQDPEFRERFLREAQAAAALQHPNIATVFELDEDHGFLAMELVEGPSLRDKIRERPLKLNEALHIVSQVSEGLRAAHERGIVHRDIKSGNILLTPEGQAKITDFGLAALADRTRVTKTGAVLGTPGYMAPEQARGEKVDRRADIWALGVVLYEMLAGRLPFRGDSEAAVVHSILNDEPEPLTASRAGLPLEVDRVVGKCLSKDAADRYQHAEDVLVDLQFLGKLPPRASAPGRRSRLRRRIAVAGALFFAGIIAGLCLGLLVGPTPVPNGYGAEVRPFAAESAAETQPAWSPDGESLAYLMEIDGINQVFARSLDSPGATQITKSTASCHPPAWSGDGTRVYYAVAGDLWSSGVTGGEPRLELKEVAYPALSPDGKTLAFVRGSLGAQRVYLASTADLKPQEYARAPFLSTWVAIYRPAFSMDGSRIAVAADRSSGGGAPEL